MVSELLTISAVATVFLSLFSIIGLPFRRFVTSLGVPTAGFIFFLAVIPPATFFLGHFRPELIIAFVVLCAVTGLFLIVKGQKPQWLWTRRSLISVFLFLTIILVFTSLTFSRHPVPPGADSISHARYAEELRSSGTIRISYPIGGHMSLAFVAWLLDLPMHTALQGFQVALYVLFFSSFATITKIFFRSEPLVYVSLAIGLLDVSFYNNLLNGSTSHLVGIISVFANLSLYLFLYLHEVRNGKKPWVASFVLLLGFIGLFYAHTTTYAYYVVLALALRIFTAAWVGVPLFSRFFFGALGVAFVFSLPFYQTVVSFDPSSAIVVPIIFVAAITLELLYRLIRLMYRQFHLDIPPQHLLRVVSFLTLAASAYFVFSLDFPSWYGQIMSVLAFAGLTVLVVRLSPFSFLPVVFAALVASSWLIQRFFASSLFEFSLINQYIFYQGLTVVFLLASVAFFHWLIVNGSSRRMVRFLTVSVVAVLAGIFAFPTLLSRAFDVQSGSHLFVDQNADSRFQTSGGFSVFFTPEDLELASWMRENLPPGGRIFNLGGFYSSWYFISGWPTVYDRGGVWPFHVPYQHAAVAGMFKKLQSWDPSVVEDFQLYDIRYLVVPTGYPILLQQPFLRQMKEVGGARLYGIRSTGDGIQTPKWFTTASTILSQTEFAAEGLEASAEYQTFLHTVTYDGNLASSELVAKLAPGGKMLISLSNLKEDTHSIRIEAAGYSGTATATAVSGTIRSTGSATFSPSGILSILKSPLLSPEPLIVSIENQGSIPFIFASLAVFEEN